MLPDACYRPFCEPEDLFCASYGQIPPTLKGSRNFFLSEDFLLAEEIVLPWLAEGPLLSNATPSRMFFFFFLADSVRDFSSLLWFSVWAELPSAAVVDSPRSLHPSCYRIRGWTFFGLERKSMPVGGARNSILYKPLRVFSTSEIPLFFPHEFFPPLVEPNNLQVRNTYIAELTLSSCGCPPFREGPPQSYVGRPNRTFPRRVVVLMRGVQYRISSVSFIDLPWFSSVPMVYAPFSSCRWGFSLFSAMWK